ncbi:MAG: VRR-NUC domain-containing protein [Candidatus Cloacimonetes bacterium]|nr:VRR-NUC domain-containing protein [Candidatus Cloacimonadota bacterium]
MPASTPSQPDSTPADGIRPPLPTGYYLDNFELLRDTVLEHDRDLLSPDELAALDTFATLSLDARRLALRIHGRRPGWLRITKLNYDEIAKRETALDELERAGFVELFTGEEGELESVLATLDSASCRRWMRDTELPRNLRSPELHELLLNHIRSQPDLLRDMLREEGWVRFVQGDLFRTLCLLFFGNPHQGLSDFVISAVGNLVYPSVPVSRVRLFTDLEARRACQSAIALRENLALLREEEGGPVELFHEAALLALARLEDCPPRDEPGDHLWRRQLEAVIAVGAEMLERADQAEAALPLHDALERLAASSRRREQASARLLILGERSGLEHEHCLARCTRVCDDRLNYSPAFRRQTARRARRLARRLDLPLPEAPAVRRAPEIVLHATRLPDRAGRSRWLLPEGNEGTVEELVLAHRTQGGAKGGHLENSLPRALMGVLCWDEIYRPLPGRFLHRFQATPLDWGGTGFLPPRREGLERLLARVEAGEALELAEACWSRHAGELNPCLDWITPGRELLMDVLRRWPADSLAEMLRNLLGNLQHWRQGFPDLTLVDGERLCFVEVKSPGDRLSAWQEEWHDWLLANGLAVEVCLVREQE